MNILITGANNYIAHDLINFFSDKKSNKIIATYKKKIKKIKKKNIIYEKIDLTKNFSFDHKFDVLIHCAAATPFKFYTKKEYEKINIEGFKKILKLCKKKIRNIILFSTVSVYGKIDVKVISEKTPLNGQTNYAKSKIAMENILKKFSKKNNTKILILRLPGVIGTGINHNNFLSETISKIKENKEFNLFNPNFFFNNLVTTKGLYKIINKFIYKKNKKKIEIYNCGSKNSQKLIRIIFYIARIFKTKPKFIIINSKSKNFTISTKKILKNNYPIDKIEKSLKEILI